MRSRTLVLVPVMVALIGACAGDRAAPAQGTGETVAFEEATLIVEVNATDGDAGLQVFLDHEPWSSISIARPDGTEILAVSATGVLASHGLTELFSESSEPPFDELPLDEFKTLFPAGDYVFSGRTIDGAAMRSVVELSHDLPAGPEITSPGQDEEFASGDLDVEWGPGDQPDGVDIVAYEVVVETEDEPVRAFSADLDADARSVRVPGWFFADAGEYKVEVLAIEAGGNQTATEVAFIVG